jgi:predicted ATPase
LFALPDARDRLQEIGSAAWVNSVLLDPGKRWFIRTDPDNDATHLELDGEGKASFGSQTSGMKRTLLSSCSQAGHQPTAFLARRALARIALYHFEPSALRSPDLLSEGFDQEQPIDSRGRHLPLALLRLSERDPSVTTKVANTLATVVEGIDSLRHERNDVTKTVEIRLTDLQPREFAADSLSDGTLRVLALALLLHDSRVLGTLLLEEPENGVHPNQLPSLLNLLRDIACDTDLPVDETNPLRQVCFTTHSPGLVGLLRTEEMRFAVRGTANLGEIRFLPVGPSGVPTHLLWGFLHEDGAEITGTLAAQAEEFTRALSQP